MTNLLLLQYTCFLVSLLLAPIIIVSYFIQEGTNRRYERSRWMLVTAVLLLALHYFLQMRFSIRATTDTGATVVNILFYTPAAFLFSGSVLGLEGDSRRFRSYVLFGAMCTFLILLLFFIGWLRNGCLEMPYVQPIMHAVYFVVMIVFVLVPWKAIRRSRKRVINETGGDIVPYNRFVGSAYLLMSTTLSVLVIAIVWRPLLFIIAPFGLFAIFFPSSASSISVSEWHPSGTCSMRMCRVKNRAELMMIRTIRRKNLCFTLQKWRRRWVWHWING